MTPGFPTFLLLLWYWNPFGAFWSFLMAVCVHELAHIVVLRLLGGKIERIRFRFAQVELETGLLPLKTELWTAAAGPCVNLFCAGIFGRVMPVFAATSALLGLFNLLPVEPLDGGRILRVLLSWCFGESGGQIAKILANVCIAGMLVIAASAFWVRGDIACLIAGMVLAFRLLRLRRIDGA